MKPVCLLLSVLLSFILKTNVSVFDVSLNLTVAVVYFVGINSGTTRGVLIGSAVGIIEDSIAGGMLGPHLLGKGLVGFFSSMLLGRFVRWTPLLGFLGLFFIAILDGLIVYLVRFVYEPMPSSFLRVALIILMQGLMNSVFGFFLRPKNA